MNNSLKNLLIARLATLLAGSRHVAVGASSPIPAAGALLAQVIDPSLQVSLLGSEKYSAFTDGGRELFDCAAQGRIDTFFLSGVQIDGAANINLVGTGDYPQMRQRYAGSFGSAYLYHHVPRVILFCWAHSSKTLVDKVDFISAAGPRNDGVWRRGGPVALLTDRCEFRWVDQASADTRTASDNVNQVSASGSFLLESMHPGESHDSIVADTGFAFLSTEDDKSVEPTAAISDCALAEVEEILKGTVLPRLEECYPRFAKRYIDESVAS